LANPAYADKAPAKIVEQTKQQLEQEKSLLIQAQTEIDTFSKLVES